jgi:membrane dipeptidase
MKVIDGHCDVLSKMYKQKHMDINSEDALDVTLSRMKKAGMLMQSFAIYLSENIKNPCFDHILENIDLFHRKILICEDVMFIRTTEDLQYAFKFNKIGALLTLEGADALKGNFTHLRTLYYLGVRCIGITWNYANWAADGVLEPRQGGFTIKGYKLIRECNQIGMILDVSHLTEKAFWELSELSTKPFIASHSNVFEKCHHPRNLKNEQIKTVIKKGGIMGLTFVPYFINEKGTANITDLLKHIDHVCALGGKRHISFGSDFDGINQWVTGLEHTGKFFDLQNMLYKYFSIKEVEGFMWKNWFDFYNQNLPSQSI